MRVHGFDDDEAAGSFAIVASILELQSFSICLLHADKKVNWVWSIFQAKVDGNLSKLIFISWLFRIVLNSCNLSTNIWPNRWNDSYIVIESLSMENCWSKKTIILWWTIVQLGGRYTVIPGKLLEFRGELSINKNLRSMWQVLLE